MTSELKSGSKLRLRASRECKRRLCVLLILVAACIFVPVAHASQSWASEYELKAAFVYNLIPFVEWSASLSGPMVVCFATDGPEPETFVKFFSGKRAGAREIQVRPVHSRSEMRGCRVALLAFQDAARTREALAQLSGSSVLTVGDGEEFARLGGVMAFLRSGNTFRLAVNPQAAERAGLKIRAQLMNMVTLVADGRSEP